MKAVTPNTYTSRKYTQVASLACLAGLIAAASITGCASTQASSGSGETVMEAVSAKPTPAQRAASAAGPAVAAPQGPNAAQTSSVAQPAIAMVNNQPLSYVAWINLLKRSHGLPAFQYMLGVELARQAALAKGIVLTEDQMEQAFRQEVAQVAGSDQDQAQQQRVLQAVLARRGITMDEFRLLSRRNAYLRRLVEPIVERSLTDEMLKAEFDRLYGEKVQIRHIQLSDGNQIAKAQQAIAEGTDFAEVAQQLSQNIETAKEGGLLPPFSRSDPAAPTDLRQLAFSTDVGKVAGPVRVDKWHHFIKVEARIPAQPVEYDAVATQVRQSLKEQMVLQEMQKLLQNLLQSAVIQVQDTDLNREFQALKAEQLKG